MTEIITDYHSKYLASDLVRRRSSDSSEKLAVAVAGAQVDMNPHQVDAALFAFASPLSKGALLADEVGLGKTIEAGLVISQRWAEGKRRILIIAPSNLRKQLHQEMNEKFFIPCTIFESKPYNAEVKAGNFRPFDRTDSIVICSYRQMDRRDRQTVRYGQGLRAPPAPLGRRTDAGMAQPKPTPRQGLRANHRLSHRMAVHGLDPAVRSPYRKTMKSRRIILNQTLSIPQQAGPARQRQGH